jgi:two-component system, response regulator PdtaR
MSRSLRILIADDELDVREYFNELLADLGHEVVGSAATGSELLRECRSRQPDLIITDVRMPDGDGLTAVKQYTAERFVPVILVTAFMDQEILQEACDAQVFAYLVKPIGRPQLESAVAIAWQRFEQFESLRREAANLRQALSDRKLIERAKGILMKQAQLDEEAAFRRLQKLAREENKKLAQIAEMIITAHRAFDAE